MWKYREQLTYFEKLRRSLYEILRDSLELKLIKIALLDSFNNHLQKGEEYSFIDRSELKPASKKMERESALFNTFLIIFCEGTISPELKNYIRFFPENKLIKKNIVHLADFRLYKRFNNSMKYFEKPYFFDLLESMLNIDYALLIQQDPTVRKKNRYALTHFHVKIDWPIAEAAQDLAKHLRYIQHNLYENGDKDARILQNKLFEYYGCHHSVGGRRTAGLIAAQLLRKMGFISTVYVSSAESRSLIKYWERGVTKFYLVRLTDREISTISEKENMEPDYLKKIYLYPVNDYYIGVCEAIYEHTPHSLPPPSGKLRKVRSAPRWLRLKSEYLHPNQNNLDHRPIPYIWTKEEG